jgi:hypothetical protein
MVRRHHRPVFVDRSGRRRRLVVASGAAAAVLILLALITLVAGFSGAAPLHVPGFPDFGKAPDAGAQTPNPGDATGADSGGTGPENTQNAVPGASASVDPTRRHTPTQTPTHPGKPTKT